MLVRAAQLFICAIEPCGVQGEPPFFCAGDAATQYMGTSGWPLPSALSEFHFLGFARKK